MGNKLLFSREQDLNDALGIYVRQYAVLDMEYLEKVCEKLGVRDALYDLRKKYEIYGKI